MRALSLARLARATTENPPRNYTHRQLAGSFRQVEDENPPENATPLQKLASTMRRVAKMNMTCVVNDEWNGCRLKLQFIPPHVDDPSGWDLKIVPPEGMTPSDTDERRAELLGAFRTSELYGELLSAFRVPDGAQAAPARIAEEMWEHFEWSDDPPPSDAGQA